MYEKATKYILYARKSSEADDRQTISIESQVSNLRELAISKGLNVVEILEESKSAKAPGRPIFNALVAKLQSGEVDGIICWKTNRLTRNPVDSGSLQWLLQGGTIKHICTSERDYWPEDNALLMGVEMSMANQFIRDLSVDTKRGLKTKADKGWLPAKPSFGYIHNHFSIKGEKEILNDPDRFEVIQKALQGIASGKYMPLEAYRIATKEWGLRNKEGRELSRSQWYYLMNNPFYYGRFEYPRGSGQWYQGQHNAMITEQEFYRIQTILGKKGATRPQKYTFPYSGTMRCGHCGASITAENKVKRTKGGRIHFYTYYHCTKRKDPSCPERVIEEKALEQELLELLSQIHIPKAFKDWAVKYFKETAKEELELDKKVRESHIRTYNSIEKKLSSLIDLRVSGELSEEEFLSKKQETLDEKKHLKELIDKPLSKNWVERLDESLSVGIDVVEKFQNGGINEKKQLIHSLGSNLLLKDKKLTVEGKNPLFHIQKLAIETGAFFEGFEPPEFRLDKTKNTLSGALSSSWLRR